MSKKPKIDKRLDNLFKGIVPEKINSKPKDNLNVQNETPLPSADSLNASPPRPTTGSKKSEAASSLKPTQSHAPAQIPSEPVVVTQENENITSSYSINFQTGYQDWSTLRVLDEATQRELTPDEEMLVKQVSDQLSLALENARLFQEAQKFKLGIDRTDNAVFITDPEGVIQYINPGFEKVYGFKSEEVLGKTPRILKSGVIPDEQYKYFWDTLLKGGTVSGELINKTKDGRIIPIAGTNSPILDENGKILGFLAVHQDISERKKNEEALAKSEADLRALFSSMEDIVLVYDRDGRYVRIAPTNPSLLIKPPEELLGQLIHEVFPKETADRFLVAIKKYPGQRRNQSN